MAENEQKDNWEIERCTFELLKQKTIFKKWKKEQFICQTGKCAYCSKPLQYRYTETDHIRPLYKGGTSEPNNMVLCHHYCNKKKGTKVGYEKPKWMKENQYAANVYLEYAKIRKEVVKGNTASKKNNGLSKQQAELIVDIIILIIVLSIMFIFF